MAIQILSCPSDGSGVCAFPFYGFLTATNKYGSLTICDWDCCLYGDGTHADSVYVDGIGTLNQPTPPADPSCDSSDNFKCSGASLEYDEDGNCTVKSGWDGAVDGHITYTALNDCMVKVTDATGSLASQLGSVLPMPDISSVIGEIQADNYAYENIINSYCNNPDGSNIFLLLGDPSPDNT